MMFSLLLLLLMLTLAPCCHDYFRRALPLQRALLRRHEVATLMSLFYYAMRRCRRHTTCRCASAYGDIIDAI